MTHELPAPDTPADRDAPAPCQLGGTATDGRGRAIDLMEHAFVVHVRGGRRVRALTEPGDPSFLELPRVDLDDGRPLRRAAFEIWASHVRAKLGAGASWETSYQPPRPYHTTFAILGATLLGGTSLWSLAAWASSDPQVRVQPGLVDGVLLLAGAALLLWISFATISSAARYWLTRRGSWVRVDARGVTLGKGSTRVAASDVAGVAHHPFLRASEVRLRDGGRYWVPREKGPLARLDLVLAALPGGPAADV